MPANASSPSAAQASGRRPAASEGAAFNRGDVVQITDEAHPWYGCLLVVTEPKPWGVQGFVSWPETNEPGGAGVAVAYGRPRTAQLARVGRTALPLAEAD